eukprot:gene6106-2707_t
MWTRAEDEETQLAVDNKDRRVLRLFDTMHRTAKLKDETDPWVLQHRAAKVIQKKWRSIKHREVQDQNHLDSLVTRDVQGLLDQAVLSGVIQARRRVGLSLNTMKSFGKKSSIARMHVAATDKHSANIRAPNKKVVRVNAGFGSSAPSAAELAARKEKAERKARKEKPAPENISSSSSSPHTGPPPSPSRSTLGGHTPTHSAPQSPTASHARPSSSSTSTPTPSPMPQASIPHSNPYLNPSQATFSPNTPPAPPPATSLVYAPYDLAQPAASAAAPIPGGQVQGGPVMAVAQGGPGRSTPTESSVAQVHQHQFEMDISTHYRELPPGHSSPQPGHSSLQPGHSSQQPGHSSPQPGHSSLQPGHSSQQPGHSSLQPGHSSQQPGHSSPQPGHSSLQPGHSSQQPGHSSPQPGHSSLQPRHSSQQIGHSSLQPDHSSLQPGHSPQLSGHSSLQPGHSSLQPGHSPQHTGHSFQQPGHSSLQPGHSSLQPGHSSQQPVPSPQLSVPYTLQPVQQQYRQSALPQPLSSTFSRSDALKDDPSQLLRPPELHNVTVEFGKEPGPRPHHHPQHRPHHHAPHNDMFHVHKPHQSPATTRSSARLSSRRSHPNAHHRSPSSPRFSRPERLSHSASHGLPSQPRDQHQHHQHHQHPELHKETSLYQINFTAPRTASPTRNASPHRITSHRSASPPRNASPRNASPPQTASPSRHGSPRRGESLSSFPPASLSPPQTASLSRHAAPRRGESLSSLPPASASPQRSTASSFPMQAEEASSQAHASTSSQHADTSPVAQQILLSVSLSDGHRQSVGSPGQVAHTQPQTAEYSPAVEDPEAQPQPESSTPSPVVNLGPQGRSESSTPRAVVNLGPQGQPASSTYPSVVNGDTQAQTEDPHTHISEHQMHTAAPPPAMPESEVQAQSMAPQATPPQATPPQATPPQAMLEPEVQAQSMAPQAMLPPATPPQATPPQATPPQAMPESEVQAQSMDPKAAASQQQLQRADPAPLPPTPLPQATHPQAMAPQATPPQATPPQATPPQATLPQATHPQAMAPQAMLPPATPPQATPPQATPPQAMLEPEVQAHMASIPRLTITPPSPDSSPMPESAEADPSFLPSRPSTLDLEPATANTLDLEPVAPNTLVLEPATSNMQAAEESGTSFLPSRSSSPNLEPATANIQPLQSLHRRSAHDAMSNARKLKGLMPNPAAPFTLPVPRSLHPAQGEDPPPLQSCFLSVEHAPPPNGRGLKVGNVVMPPGLSPPAGPPCRASKSVRANQIKNAYAVPQAASTSTSAGSGLHSKLSAPVAGSYTRHPPRSQVLRTRASLHPGHGGHGVPGSHGGNGSHGVSGGHASNPMHPGSGGHPGHGDHGVPGSHGSNGGHASHPMLPGHDYPGHPGHGGHGDGGNGSSGGHGGRPVHGGQVGRQHSGGAFGFMRGGHKTAVSSSARFSRSLEPGAELGAKPSPPPGCPPQAWAQDVCTAQQQRQFQPSPPTRLMDSTDTPPAQQQRSSTKAASSANFPQGSAARRSRESPQQELSPRTLGGRHRDVSPISRGGLHPELSSRYQEGLHSADSSMSLGGVNRDASPGRSCSDPSRHPAQSTAVLGQSRDAAKNVQARPPSSTPRGGELRGSGGAGGAPEVAAQRLEEAERGKGGSPFAQSRGLQGSAACKEGARSPRVQEAPSPRGQSGGELVKRPSGQPASATPPLMDSAPPLMDSTHPLMDSAPPLMDSTPPLMDSTPPLMDSAPPLMDSTPPLMDSHTPADGQRTPADGQHTPADGQRTPADGQHPPADGQHPPADGQRTPADGQHPPADGQRTPADGQRTPESVNPVSVPAGAPSAPQDHGPSVSPGAPSAPPHHSPLVPPDVPSTPQYVSGEEFSPQWESAREIVSEPLGSPTALSTCPEEFDGDILEGWTDNPPMIASRTWAKPSSQRSVVPVYGSGEVWYVPVYDLYEVPSGPPHPSAKASSRKHSVDSARAGASAPKPQHAPPNPAIKLQHAPQPDEKWNQGLRVSGSARAATSASGASPGAQLTQR